MDLDSINTKCIRIWQFAFFFPFVSSVFSLPLCLLSVFPCPSVFCHQGVVMLLSTFLETSCLLINTLDLSCQSSATPVPVHFILLVFAL